MYEPWQIKSGENERKELWIYILKIKVPLSAFLHYMQVEGNSEF
jgi:hypothetical protein